MKRLALIVIGAVNAYAGEYAVLQNGFRIAADYHLVSGSLIQLHTKQGTMELPAEKIVRFEQEDYIATPPAETTETGPQKKAAITQVTPRDGLWVLPKAIQMNKEGLPFDPQYFN